MTTSPAGRAAIRAREGCIPHWYRDAVGVNTCCIGHTERAGPPYFDAGKRFSEAEALAILAADLKPIELAVNEACGGHLNQDQFDAGVSLAFNIGPGAFRTSSVARHCRAQEWALAADAFLMWDRAGGQEMAGLLTRRRAERAQFLRSEAPPVQIAVKQETATITYSVPSPGPVAIPAPEPNGIHRLWAWLTRRNGVGA